MIEVIMSPGCGAHALNSLTDDELRELINAAKAILYGRVVR